MSKQLTETSFQRKPFSKPQMNVVEIDRTDLICTSPNGENEEYGNGNTDGWFNP